MATTIRSTIRSTLRPVKMVHKGTKLNPLWNGLFPTPIWGERKTIIIIGDSVTEGYYSDAAGNLKNTFFNGYAGKLRQHRQTEDGDGGIGFIPMYGYAWTEIGTWESGNYAPYGSSKKATGTGNKYTLNVEDGDNVDLFYYDSATSGNFTYKVNGGSEQTVTALNDDLHKKINIDLTTTGAHTIEIIAPASGDLILCGAAIYKGASGFVLHNISRSASSINNMLSYPSTMWEPIFALLNPALILINYLINDYKNTGTEAGASIYEGRYIQVVDKLMGYCPYISILPGKIATEKDVAQTYYEDIVKQIAINDHTAWLSINAAWNGKYQPLLMHDDLHPNADGHLAMGNIISGLWYKLYQWIGVPTITNTQTSDISYEGFTVQSLINPNGKITTVVIEHGLTTMYGNELTVISNSPINKAFITQITGVITGYSNGDTVHYRVKATNSEGTTYTNDATYIIDDPRYIMQVTGTESETTTNGTLTLVMSENVDLSSTGDVTITTSRANISFGTWDTNTYIRHTITVSCPTAGAGSIIIPDKNKIIGLGFEPTSGSPYSLYTGTAATIPKININIDNLPSTTKSIRINGGGASCIVTGNSLPSELLSLNLNGSGSDITLTYEGSLPNNLRYLFGFGTKINITLGSDQLPDNLVYIFLDNCNVYWTYVGALPSSLTYIRFSANGIEWTYDGSLPTGLTYLYLQRTTIDYTGLDISGASNLTALGLIKYRISKMSSADMVVLLTSLTNRVGGLPTTITINDYADYASPPVEVTDAVALLKSTKGVITVNLGA